MKTVSGILLALVMAASAGTLPQMDEKPWMGWYAGKVCREFRFGVDFEGNGVLVPFNEKGLELSHNAELALKPVIEELREGGKIVTKKPEDEGWEAVTEMGTDVDRIVYRGTVKGGARFEVVFEIESKSIRASGRILEKGELTKNPIRFALRTKFRNQYAQWTDDEKIANAVEDDELRLVRRDGEKLKIEGSEVIDAESDEVSGPGLTDIRIDFGYYKGKRFDWTTDGPGYFVLQNKEPREVYRGFDVVWRSDPEKDARGEGGFTVTYK